LKERTSELLKEWPDQPALQQVFIFLSCRFQMKALIVMILNISDYESYCKD